ncbi:hypothetical protein [Bdellovibrio sp. HCB209]|uniref:hypothetical protein n=1 Tax=Bdellovibrio sp. HCB209 TaxID=3394354 RepID=UPI0039B36709
MSETAWTFWAMSFVFSPFVAFTAYAISLSKIGKEPHKNIYLSIVGRTLLFVMSLGISIFIHGFIGVFMSVALPMEPLNVYGPNGYINHFEWPYLFDIIGKYPALIVGFLCLKTSAAAVKTEDLQTGHGLVRHGVLALFFGVIGKLMDHFSAPGALGFCILTFAPWVLIVARDIHSKARAKEADLSPEPSLPAHFIDKASAFWGSVVLLFGLVFLTATVVFTIYIFKTTQTPGLKEFLASGLLFVFFGGFGSVTTVAGLAMIFGYTKVSIYPDVVRLESLFRSSVFRIHRWSEQTSQFRLEKAIERSTDTEGGRYTTYSVKYTHKSDSKKNITLYRSYHPDDLDAKFAAWKQALPKFE